MTQTRPLGVRVVSDAGFCAARSHATRVPSLSQVQAKLSPALSDSERTGVPRHLFVLVHGLKGQPSDLTTLKESLLSLTERTAVVHLAEANHRRAARAAFKLSG